MSLTDERKLEWAKVVYNQPTTVDDILEDWLEDDHKDIMDRDTIINEVHVDFNGDIQYSNEIAHKADAPLSDITDKEFFRYFLDDTETEAEKAAREAEAQRRNDERNAEMERRWKIHDEEMKGIRPTHNPDELFDGLEMTPYEKDCFSLEHYVPLPIIEEQTAYRVKMETCDFEAGL